jgi:hypothetical protein
MKKTKKEEEEEGRMRKWYTIRNKIMLILGMLSDLLSKTSTPLFSNPHL